MTVDVDAAADPERELPPDLESDDFGTRLLAGVVAETRRREAAREIVRTERARARRPAAPSPVRLDHLLAEPDEPAVYRVGRLWPVGGRVMLVAAAKSGKSTMVANLVRSLVDGGQFLGAFATDPVRRVAILDTELDRRTLRRWYRDSAIDRTDAVGVWPLRGRVAALDLLDDDCRRDWVDALRGVDVLVLDNLRPVMDALGLDENRDAGRFLVAFDALLTEAGIAEAVVVHHAGHAGERARGDSRLQDWPDASWKLVTGGDGVDGPRYFSAFGRDVEVYEGRLDFDRASRSLAYRTGSRRDAGAEETLPDVLAFLAESPGLSTRDVERAFDGSDHSRDRVRAALNLGASRGWISKAPGPQRATLHSLTDPCDVCGKAVTGHAGDRHLTCGSSA